MWTNYHSHSHYCDGKEPITAHLESAVDKGFYAFGCSSHAPVSFENKWSMDLKDLPRYVQEIHQLKEKYAGKLFVYAGLEVDYIPGMVGPHSDYIQAAGLDYTVGSVHFVEAFDHGYPWCIDGTHKLFLEGIDQIWEGDLQAATSRYYELTRQMVREECPDVVGHLDKIKMQSEDNQLFSEQSDWYQEAMADTLATIKEAGVIIEVNTRGIYQKKFPRSTPYPSPWVLEEIHRLGIPICLNSDSHHPKDIDGEFIPTAAMLKKIGFEHLMIFDDQGWRPVPFTETGIVI